MNTLYRSVNSGTTWTIVTPQELNVTSAAQARVWFIAPSADTVPGSSESKVWLGGPSALWTTVDGIRFVRYDRTPSFLYPHPVFDDVAMAMFGGSPCELYITTNFGKSWSKASNGQNPVWVQVSDKIQFMHMVSCSTSAPNGIATTTWNENQTPKATDFMHRGLFKSLTDVAHTGYVTATDNHEQVFLAIDQDDELVISRNARNWITAFIPSDTTSLFTQFVPYGVDDGSVILAARAPGDGGNTRSAHVFFSGNDTEFFAMSLANNVRSPAGAQNGIYGIGDFEKVHSLDGVFLANAFVSGNGIATYLSTDMGGEWQRLTAPSEDSEHNPINCKPENGCYLNLFGLADQHATLTDYGGYGRFYSVPSAVGIVFATGNYGATLDLAGAVNTYLSTDGGLTWKQVREGRWAYEIADHGALLALAPRDFDANYLMYTWNEGGDFVACNFSDVPITIENIITPIDFNAQSFMLYGEARNANNQPYGVLITVDFTNMHERECANPDSPNTPTSDYETWEFGDGRKCVLGMHTKYLRRKPSVACYNPDDHEINKRTYSVCQCQREDFECGPCYTSSAGSTECKLSSKCHTPTIAQQCEQNCYYFENAGDAKYFRVAGDRCVGGEMWEKHENAKPCLNRTDCHFKTPAPTSTPGDGDNGAMIAIVVGAVIVVLVIVFVTVVCVTKKPAALHAALTSPFRKSDKQYRKLNFDGANKETTSFFDDDDLANRTTE